MYWGMQAKLNAESKKAVATGEWKKRRLRFPCPDHEGSHYELTMGGRSWGWQERFFTKGDFVTKQTWFMWWEPELPLEPPLWQAEGAVALGSS